MRTELVRRRRRRYRGSEKVRMRTVAIIIAGLVGGLLGTAGPAAAGPVRVRSHHEQRTVAGADAQIGRAHV